MRNFIKISFILTLFLSCSEDKLDIVGKGIVTGKVVQAESFEPIANVKISLNPSNNTLFTDEEGNFRYDEVEVGDYTVSATKETFLTGFEAVTVTIDSETNVIFELEDDNYLNKPPSIPILLTPENNVSALDNSVELTWEALDEDVEDVLTYSLVIYNDYDNSTHEIEELTEPMYQLSNLKYGVKYFWQVSVSDGINEPVLSEVFNFTIKTNPENRYTYVKKASNGNNVIYSASINGTNELENEVQLTSDSMNSWRPRKNNTAKLIAFMGMANNEVHLFTMELNGFDVKQVTNSIPLNGFNFNEMDFAWSASGDRLVYSNFDRLYSINKDGSGLSLVYKTTDDSYISEIGWSNDESMIVIKTNESDGYNSSIKILNAQGQEINTLISGQMGAVGGLDISVDNKFVLFTHDISEFQSLDYRRLDTDIMLYNLDTDEITNISNHKPDGTLDLDPRFSPNEARVIFTNTSNDEISTRNIYSLDINSGANHRTLLIPNASMPDWE